MNDESQTRKSDIRSLDRGGHCKMRFCSTFLQESLNIFQRQLLLFPLIVVVFTSTSFLFGGKCSAWQWWISTAVVLLIPFANQKRLYPTLGATSLFALLLLSLRFLLPPIFWDVAENVDMSNCHLPMAQLLIEGWNPVSDPTEEKILSSLHLDLWGMAPLHVAFMPKTLAVFSAVAYTFINAPRALLFPLPSIFWITILLSAFQRHHGVSRWALVVALVGILPIVPWKMPVDLALAYASCGLLLTMHDTVRKRTCDWLALLVWGAWMFMLKPNGALGAALFFIVFVVSLIRSENPRLNRSAIHVSYVLAIILVVTAVVLWNPLGTSWRIFGHPLYPLRTCNQQRFPVKDLSWDMAVGNDDFLRMGKLGLFAHAYLAPRTTIAYYRWKQGTNHFEPNSLLWDRGDYPTYSARAGIIALFCILFLLKSGRPWGIAGLLLLLFVPNKYVGYLRYQPWLSALGCLSVLLFAEWAVAFVSPQNVQKVLKILVSTACLLIASQGWFHAKGMECAAKEYAVVRKQIRPIFGVPQETIVRHNPFSSGDASRSVELTWRENQIRLLVKETGMTGITKVLSLEEWMHPKDLAFLCQERDIAKPSNCASRFLPIVLGDPTVWRTNQAEFKLIQWKVNRELLAGWVATPFGYLVPDDENAAFIHEYYSDTINYGKHSYWKRFLTRTWKSFHTWFVTYPREVLRRANPRKGTFHENSENNQQ